MGFFLITFIVEVVMKYVIIGNGIAGIHAAEAIRTVDPNGSIIMISDEAFLPYCRPMISHMLEGTVSREQLAIRKANFYESLKIQPILGKRVTQIDPKNKTVSIHSDSIISYDKLLIATGADPRKIKAQGTHLAGVFYMRTELDVRQIVASLSNVKHALVLGGGLVGFKAAHGLIRRGIKTTLLIRSGYPLSMQVDEIAGKIILDELLRNGIEVRTGVDVQAFDGKTRVSSAILTDGTTLPCDIVIIGKGVLPSVSFVPKDQIKIDLGILVDHHMETSVPGVFAAGDVAETIDIARKSPWVNAIWPEAVHQGYAAGLNMAGQSFSYKGSLSRNTIRIFNTDIMSGGLFNPPPDSHYHVLSSKNHRNNTYRKLVFRDNILIGMIMINDIHQGGILLSLIQNEIPLRFQREMLMSPSLNYGKLIR